APVLGEAGRADCEGVDAAVDASVEVADQVEDGADVFATAEVLVTGGAVAAVGGGDLLLAARALDPLLGRLVAPDGRFGKILAEVAEVFDEAHRGVEDRQLLGLLPELDGGEAGDLGVPLLDQLQLLARQVDARPPARAAR